MKTILCSIGMWLGVCGSLSAQHYLIEGTAPEMDGKKVYIGETKGRNNTCLIDSAVIVDGAFKMTGKLTEVKPLTLFIDKTRQPFLLDENPLKVSYTTTMQEVKGKQVPVSLIKVSGDNDQELLKQMNNAIAQEMYSMLAISFMGKGKDVNAAENKALADSIGEIYSTAKENTKTVFYKIVTENNDSYVSAIIIRDFFSKERPITEIEQYYNALSQRVRSSNIGKEIQAIIQQMAAVETGREAPDFTLNTPDGTPLTLSSLRGKCVLLDFWASWCGPCLREAPNVKKVYDRYRDKGFEVLSVSIDEDSSKWVNAIKQHNLDWLHVSSLQGWKCPVAQLYRITGVPAMFLIDREGKIISTKARGEVLEAEVSKLCK